MIWNLFLILWLLPILCFPQLLTLTGVLIAIYDGIKIILKKLIAD